MTSPESKSTGLPNETLEKVKQFYQSDEISRECAGKKEYVSMEVNGEKVKVQRRNLS